MYYYLQSLKSRKFPTATVTKRTFAYCILYKDQNILSIIICNW